MGNKNTQSSSSPLSSQTPQIMFFTIISLTFIARKKLEIKEFQVIQYISNINFSQLDNKQYIPD